MGWRGLKNGRVITPPRFSTPHTDLELLEGGEGHREVLLEFLQLVLVVALHVLARALEADALGVDRAEGILQRADQLVATVDLRCACVCVCVCVG